MGKIIIHKSLLDHIKIDGSFIDDKVKELEMASGIYDIVGGTDCDSSYIWIYIQSYTSTPQWCVRVHRRRLKTYRCGHLLL